MTAHELMQNLIATAEANITESQEATKGTYSDGEYAYCSGRRAAEESWLRLLKRTYAELGPEF